MQSYSKKNRLFLIVLTFVMTIALLTGCSGDTTGGKAHSQSLPTVESAAPESDSLDDFVLPAESSSAESTSQSDLDEDGAVYWYENSEDLDSYFYYNVSAMSDYYAYLDDDVWALGFEIEDGSLSGMVAMCMTNAQYDEFSDMVEWTYSDEDTPLDPIRVTGWYEDWDNQDLVDYMLEGLQTFFDDDTLTEDDLTDYLGGGYMDIRDMGSING